MSIYISNALYISAGIGADINENNPIIGWHSVLTPSDIIATEYIVGRSAVNLWNPDTSSVWEGETVSDTPAVSTTQYIQLVNSNNSPIDYIGVARHNLGTVGFTYTIQHSTNGGSTWSNVTSPRVIGTDSAILDYFDQLTSGNFRIKLEKSATGSPAVIHGPIIAHIKMGVALVLQRRIYVGHKPPIVDKVRKISNGSESGQYLGPIVIRRYNTSEIKQQNNSPSFVRTYIKPFLNHINGQAAIDNTAPCTFFYSWRPSDYPNEIVYGWTNDNVELENQGGDSLGGRISWNLSMECIA